MKRILCTAFVIACIILSSCTFKGREVKNEEQTAEQMEEKINGNERIEDKTEENVQYPEVVDETGERRLLKFGDIDVENTECYFQFLLFASDYGQVVDGHFYYLRTDGSENYTVYRDKGEKVVCFTTKDCYVCNFVKFGDGFYALLKESELSDMGEEMDNILIRIDEQTGEVSEIKNMDEEIADHSLYDALFHQDLFFYDYYEDKDDYYDYNDRVIVGINLNETEGKKHFLPALCMGDGDMRVSPDDLTFIDGKVYYGLQQGKRVTLYSYDLESEEQKEVFCYDRTDSEWEEVYDIMVDKDYIYCQDYIIPRAGGEMKKLETGGVFFNSKYIFYIDEKDRVHRMSRDLREDIVVCDDIQIAGIECTEDGIYISEYNKAEEELEDKDYWDSWADPCSNNLYYMDLDGKNRKKLWDEIYTPHHGR